MRSVFLGKNLKDLGESVTLEDDKFHHLKVVRVRENEEVLLLNGEGQKAFSKVSKIEKKSIVLEILSIEEASRWTPEITLFLGVPKKEAFEDCIRMATEMGISTVIPVVSKYSQMDNGHMKRVDKLIEASLEQSNNPYLLRVQKSVSFDEAIKMMSNFEHSFAFSSLKKENPSIGSLANIKTVAIWVGPEAGFSSDEESTLDKTTRHLLNLNMPIMRTPTALCVAVGYIQGILK